MEQRTFYVVVNSAGHYLRWHKWPNAYEWVESFTLATIWEDYEQLSAEYHALFHSGGEGTVKRVTITIEDMIKRTIAVGDRVKIISNTPPDDEYDYSVYDYLVGEIGTVVYIEHSPYSDVPFEVKVDEDVYYFAERDLEVLAAE